jgi:hypothetical protein
VYSLDIIFRENVKGEEWNKYILKGEKRVGARPRGDATANETDM